MAMNSFHISLLLQSVLAVRFASFARHRSYRYASFQEPPNHTRERNLRTLNGDMK